jgi:hypothetical protein
VVTRTLVKAAGEVNLRSIRTWNLVLVVYLFVAVYAVFALPDFLVGASLSDRAEAELTGAERSAAVTAGRQVVLLAAGGLLAVLTLALTQQRDAVARARHEIDRDANWTTRYTEAVKQLGDDRTAVRFGGIYALARIAEDSERDRHEGLEVTHSVLKPFCSGRISVRG